MRPGKLVSFIFILALASGLLHLSMLENQLASAQGGPGFFEGSVPVQGSYLQAINTYPGVTNDTDEDGTLDKGCSWDDDGDGKAEQHVVVNPLIVNLENNGFNQGDRIMISFKQSVYSTTINFFAFHVYGLFSSTDQLITNDYVYSSSSGKGWPMVGPLRRVPGAIDAALGGYKHGPQDDTNSWKQGLEVENDIPEDFRVGGYQETNNCKNGDQWTQSTWWFSNCFWITIPPNAKFLFFQIAGAWNVGDAGYCKVQISKDSDGDALSDWWEMMGDIDFNMDDHYDLTLKDSNYLKKDIYVEVDYMEGHRFNAIARDNVVEAFLNCPKTLENGPIALHAEIDDSDKIPHSATIKESDFKGLKSQFFGTNTQRTSYDSKFVILAKRYAYHYCIFIHNYQKWNGTTWLDTTSGGLAEYPGDDFMVSLGSWTNGVGSVDEQAATFMHELGHNLGLLHGGSDRINYKPNYMSIMNYLFQNNKAALPNRPLTFSSKKMPDLNEASLDETRGLDGANWDWSARAHDTGNLAPMYKYAPLAFKTALQVDWDDSENFTALVQANVNHYPRYDYNSSDSEVLHGHDDWPNLLFNFTEYHKNFGDSFAGVEIDDVEMTWEIAQAMSEDAKNLVDVPSGPVQILDVQGQPSPTKQGPNSLPNTNYLVIGAVVAAVAAIVVIAMSLAVLRKRKTQPQ